MNEQVDNLREKVRQANEAVEEYRQKYGLIQARGETVSTQQLNELNSQLVIAQAERSGKEARLRTLRQLARQGRADSAPEALASSLIANLRGQEAELRRREAELLTKYGERHPLILNLRAEVADLALKIEEEVRRIVAGLESEVIVARERENTLKTNIAALETKVAQGAMADVKLRELQREAAANQELLDSFVSRLKETSAEIEIQQPDARVLSRARPANAPSSPKKAGLLTIAATGSFLLGSALGLLKDRFESGYTSARSLEEVGLPVLGVMPLLAKRQGQETPHQYMSRRPVSAYSEACRSIWASLNLQTDDRIRSLLITSSVPGEGKSTLALSLGTAVSRTGLNVVVVDADFRRPALLGITGLKPVSETFLSDLLRADTAWNDLIVRSDDLGFSLIPTRRLNVDPLAMLNSPRFHSLMERLRSEFDLVIIDSAPVLAASDSLVLSRIVDAVVVAVRWRRTRRDLVAHSINQLVRAGAGLSGTVLTRVDLRIYLSYGSADTGYSYAKGTGYYHN
jgi:polysaccharide biosynthesis transport protein